MFDEKEFYMLLAVAGGMLALHLMEDHNMSDEQVARKVGAYQKFNAELFNNGKLQDMLHESFPKVFT